MSAAKQYSKLKAVGGHVVWTDKEIFQVPFYFEGTAFDQAEWAVIKVVGRDVLLRGIRLDVRVQTTSNQVNTTVDLVTGSNVIVPATTLTLAGTEPFAELELSPNVQMPSGTYWKARIGFNESFQSFAPQGLTLTYIMSYANGPVVNPLASFDLLNDGIGFWEIGNDFVVS
jgi:hypothetical protein